MRILLTGVTGFIGSHLLKRLQQEQHGLAVLVRPGTDTKNLDANVIVDSGQVAQVAEQIAGFQPDAVIHLASCFIAQHKPEDIDQLVESNVTFPTRLLEAMQLADCKTLINTGTSWQHFENNEKRPVNLYAASKQAFECMARYYSDAHGMKVVNLKLYDTYGSGDTRPKLFATLKRIASSGESLAMSPGAQLIDILHVDDVVDAYCVCLQKLPDLPQWSSYAISSGKPLPLTELVAAFEQATGKKLNIDFGAREYRPREVMVPWNTGQTLPGWRPLIDLQTGIKRYLDAE